VIVFLFANIQNFFTTILHSKWINPAWWLNYSPVSASWLKLWPFLWSAGNVSCWHIITL